MDACLFALALWFSYVLRDNPDVIASLNLKAASSFDDFLWLYVVLIPVAPLVLDSQGFYKHDPLSSRREILWPLLKGCVLITVVLVLTSYFFHLNVARGIIIWFGFIAFGVVWVKEEFVRLLFRSRIGQSQFNRRFIIAGTEAEIARVRHDLKQRTDTNIEIVAEFNLGRLGVPELAQMLHDPLGQWRDSQCAPHFF